MSEICSPITPHGFECHCEGRFRHIAPDALWTLLNAHTEVGSGNDIESRIPGRCENGSGYATAQSGALFLGRRCREILLPLSFRWQPNIATTQMSTSSLRRWCEHFPTRLNSNKGTKCDMAISLIPFDRWIFGLWATPKMAPHLVHQFWGGRIPMLSRSFSSEKSYSPSRLRCCQATAEPWATASRNASRLAVSLISSNFCER
jgi:hypothetical protein